MVTKKNTLQISFISSFRLKLAALMEDKIKPRHIKPFHNNCNAIVFSLANFLLSTLKASLIFDVIISSCLRCHCLDLVKIDVLFVEDISEHV